MLNDGYDMNVILKTAEQNLTGQGYEVTTVVMGQNGGSLTVRKDRDGIKNFAGMGVECQATITVINGNSMSVNVESEWGNKIVAFVVGWFLCFIPIITGVMGASNQSSLPNKIITAIQAGASASPAQ